MNQTRFLGMTTKQSFDRKGNLIKPCQCGCRTLGLRCIRVEDEDTVPPPELEQAAVKARYLP